MLPPRLQLLCCNHRLVCSIGCSLQPHRQEELSGDIITPFNRLFIVGCLLQGLLLIFIFVLFGLLRLVWTFRTFLYQIYKARKNLRNQQGYQGSSSSTSSTSADGQRSGHKKKVFDDNEGEYVEFEEVKDWLLQCVNVAFALFFYRFFLVSFSFLKKICNFVLS